MRDVHAASVIGFSTAAGTATAFSLGHQALALNTALRGESIATGISLGLNFTGGTAAYGVHQWALDREVTIQGALIAGGVTAFTGAVAPTVVGAAPPAQAAVAATLEAVLGRGLQLAF